MAPERDVDGGTRIVPAVRALRRAVVALGVAGAIASALRLVVRQPERPPSDGGWRELSGPDLR